MTTRKPARTEKEKLAWAIWRAKHPDYRSDSKSEDHPSVLDYQNGTVLVPLLKQSVEELRRLAAKNRVDEFRDGRFIGKRENPRRASRALRKVRRNPTAREHAEIAKGMLPEMTRLSNHLRQVIQIDPASGGRLDDIVDAVFRQSRYLAVELGKLESNFEQAEWPPEVRYGMTHKRNVELAINEAKSLLNRAQQRIEKLATKSNPRRGRRS